VLVELGVVEQRYDAVKEVLDGKGCRRGLLDRRLDLERLRLRLDRRSLPVVS
jgi:hypothetical protein